MTVPPDGTGVMFTFVTVTSEVSVMVAWYEGEISVDTPAGEYVAIAAILLVTV